MGWEFVGADHRRRRCSAPSTSSQLTLITRAVWGASRIAAGNNSLDMFNKLAASDREKKEKTKKKHRKGKEQVVVGCLKAVCPDSQSDRAIGLIQTHIRKQITN
jgi:hypothetical protein